ncbi:hypothetical protein BDA99DRAFT_579407 [Phascolomyces articulosus]|uniref:Uncharacterized protein n=1 Tax=Phascolomyces articulosus TaxID=60185 RepID=A0AAD5PEJ2_9FUNG|nr:hypothetical protein BDA99DRAFT_579407 [Phascolomyces articulosus]
MAGVWYFYFNYNLSCLKALPTYPITTFIKRPMFTFDLEHFLGYLSASGLWFDKLFTYMKASVLTGGIICAKKEFELFTNFGTVMHSLMHWLPSYPIKTCRCGEINATREHYKICPRLQPLLLKLIDHYGTIPDLKLPVQPSDYILNNLPRNEVVLGNKRWIKVWPALIRVLREIDFLSHADADFNLDDEPDPEVTMKQQQNNTQS